jgi:hypothetical protein
MHGIGVEMPQVGARGYRVECKVTNRYFPIPESVKIKSVGLTASGFAFGELLGKAPQVTKGACSWLGPTSSGSFTPVSLRGPAAIRHPWRGAALAASMPLGPLRKTCVQPAPKSRLAVFEPLAYEDQRRIEGRSAAMDLWE